ncbi:MAG: acylphosphatase [Chloroflexota bacterium]|nr:acylphosphatase [Chloroflexota bacterium]
MTQQRTIQIFGHVQGVSFRASIRALANRLGLTGSASNQRDGSLLVIAEGNASALEELIAWCQTGPPSAQIDRVVVSAGEPAGSTSFTIG